MKNISLYIDEEHRKYAVELNNKVKNAQTDKGKYEALIEKSEYHLSCLRGQLIKYEQHDENELVYYSTDDEFPDTVKNIIKSIREDITRGEKALIQYKAILAYINGEEI